MTKQEVRLASLKIALDNKANMTRPPQVIVAEARVYEQYIGQARASGAKDKTSKENP